MATMKSLTMWVKCPIVSPTTRSIKYCFKCDYFAGSIDDEIKCIYRDK